MAHQIFRKEFYKSCSELKLNEFFSNIHEIYPSININILKTQIESVSTASGTESEILKLDEGSMIWSGSEWEHGTST